MTPETGDEAMERHEEWLEKQVPEPMGIEQDAEGIYATCGKCGQRLMILMGHSDGLVKFGAFAPKWCPACGQLVKRWL